MNVDLVRKLPGASIVDLAEINKYNQAVVSAVDTPTNLANVFLDQGSVVGKTITTTIQRFVDRSGEYKTCYVAHFSRGGLLMSFLIKPESLEGMLSVFEMETNEAKDILNYGSEAVIRKVLSEPVGRCFVREEVVQGEMAGDDFLVADGLLLLEATLKILGLWGDKKEAATYFKQNGLVGIVDDFQSARFRRLGQIIAVK